MSRQPSVFPVTKEDVSTKPGWMVRATSLFCRNGIAWLVLLVELLPAKAIFVFVSALRQEWNIPRYLTCLPHFRADDCDSQIDQ